MADQPRAGERKNTLPPSFAPQVRPHVRDETCWCKPILTDERIYHRDVRETT